MSRAVLRRLPMRGYSIRTPDLADRLGVGEAQVRRWADVLGWDKRSGESRYWLWTEQEQWAMAVMVVLLRFFRPDFAANIADVVGMWSQRQGYAVIYHEGPRWSAHFRRNIGDISTGWALTTIIDLAYVDSMLGPPEFIRDVDTGSYL